MRWLGLVLLLACDSDTKSKDGVGGPGPDTDVDVKDDTGDSETGDPDTGEPQGSVDADDDGVLEADDCDDTDPTLGDIADDSDCDGLLSSEDCDDSDPTRGDIAEDADCDGSLTADDCDDSDASAYPGADEIWGDGVDQDCDGVVDVEGASCSADLSVSFPDGSSTALDGCLDWDFEAAFEYDPDDPPEVLDFQISLGATTETDFDCRLELDQQGVCGSAYYDQRDESSSTTLVLMDCSGVDDAYEDSFEISEGYLWVQTLDAGSTPGSFAGDPLETTLEATLYFVTADGVELEGEIALTLTQVADDGEEQTECVGTDGDEDDDGHLAMYFDGIDCDDDDPSSTLVDDDADCDGAETDDDCDDDDPDVSPGESEDRLWVDADCDGEILNSLSVADSTFVGEAYRDQSGSVVSSAGDVDGDGLDDLLIGALYSDYGDTWAPKIYLILGSSVAEGVDLVLGDADYIFSSEGASNYAGRAMSSAGDVDGDGLDDVLIGAYGAGDDAQGKVYLMLGASLGSTSEIDLEDADHVFVGEDADDMAGIAVTGAGDVDGDGLDDVLIGAPGHDQSSGSSFGEAYLFLGSSLGSSSEISLADADFRFLGEKKLDYMGSAVSLGDFDGDGLADLIIGAYGNDDEGSRAGKIYVILASSIGTSVEFDIEDADYSFTGEVADDYAGMVLSSAGDVDGDGLDDLLFGVPENDDAGDTAGKAYLFLAGSLGGGSDFSLADADYLFLGGDAEDDSGCSVSSAGDIDGDGLADLLIGADGQDEAASNAGTVYVVMASDLGATAEIELSSLPHRLFGENASDFAGNSVALAGDVNGDGAPDLLVGASLNDDSEEWAGKTYLLLGGP